MCDVGIPTVVSRGCSAKRRAGPSNERTSGVAHSWPPGMAADPLLASYLQITEETDRLMGFSQAQPEPLEAQVPAPEPQPAVPAVAAVPRRRALRKPQLGPGRRAQLASRIAQEQENELQDVWILCNFSDRLKS